MPTPTGPVSKATYSLAYVETGRAPTGEILRAYAWAAWWTDTPSAKPWRTPDAFGLVPRDGPGCGLHGIDYEADEKADVAADNAIRSAVRCSAPDIATARCHESFARAAYRESLGKPARYTSPRGRQWFAPPLGHDRPPTMPARDWWAAWHVENAKRAAHYATMPTGFGREAGETDAEFTARFVAFMDERAPGWRPGSVSPAHPAVVALGLVPPFTAEDVRRAYRRSVSTGRLHPDHGGDRAAFERITAARDEALGLTSG